MAAPLGFGAGQAHQGISPLARTLFALAAIMGTSQSLGRLFRHLGQPPVMGEVLGGILLGPSLLGWLSPSLFAFLLPPEVVPSLSVIAKIGVILYMFFVGLELDTAMLARQGYATVLISHASIVVPFALGSLLACVLYPLMAASDVPFHVFALFLGASMSVTAFPVLARILTDQRLHQTPLGVLALACAAIDDVTAWCILAAVLAVATSQPSTAILTLAWAAAFVVFMWLAVKPLVDALVRRCEQNEAVSLDSLGKILILAVLSACATEAIGIHALFGAFSLGALVPHDSRLARELLQSLWNLVSVLLLPAFFAFTGLRTQIGLVQGLDQWLMVLAIIAVASLGKFGGTFLAARGSGFSTRDSASLGILMNTRGLMELIVLNLGLELHILSPRLFAMFVLMALATTFATTPLLALVRGRDRQTPAEGD